MCESARLLAWGEASSKAHCVPAAGHYHFDCDASGSLTCDCGRITSRDSNIQAVYIAYRVLFHHSTFTVWTALGYFATSGLVFFLYRQLQRMSRGADISGSEGGLVAYFYDIIYVTWFVHITSMFWEKMWYTYLVIPTYAFHKLYTSVIRPYLSSSGEGTPEPAVGEKNPRRDKKTKIKYAR